MILKVLVWTPCRYGKEHLHGVVTQTLGQGQVEGPLYLDSW